MKCQGGSDNVLPMTKMRQDNDVTNIQVQSVLKMKRNCDDRTDGVWFMMKKKQDNDMTYCTSVVYVEIKIKLPWLIRQYAVYNEK